MQTFIIFLFLAAIFTTTIVTTSTSAFAQVPPPLEKNDTDKSSTTPALSLGKATIPVSSGEQIIIDIPLKDGNTYKLVPIK